MPRRGGRISVLSWALYDFANSSFTTLVVTFVYASFFSKAMCVNVETGEVDETAGTALWSRGIAITGITVALLSPALGALADRGGYRKLFLLVCTVVCIAATAYLYTYLPGETLAALGCFVVANIAYELGCVFYNAFLPDIASRDEIGRISGYGWALGYVGGLLALVAGYFGLVDSDAPFFGLFSTDNHQHVRATNLLVAVWFAVFSLPIFLFVREDRSRMEQDRRWRSLVRSSIRQSLDTFREVRRYRQIVRLLVARLFYNDGLVTIFAFGGIYATVVFDFATGDLMLFGITLNVAAGLGAFALGFLDDVLGGKRTIFISIAALFAAGVVAISTSSKTVFWIAAILIGIFAGPNQSASRSLLGRFVPLEKENEFFGFFALSGKFTAFLGPLVFGLLTEAFDSHRMGMSIVLVQFVIGGLILMSVNEKDGVRLSGREES